MTKETILKKAEAWVNDGDWGYPDDRTGQWMFKKLVEAFTEGAKAMEEYREQEVERLKKTIRDLDILIYGNYFEDSEGNRIPPTEVKTRD